jgi:hypothetical protein
MIQKKYRLSKKSNNEIECGMTIYQHNKSWKKSYNMIWQDESIMLKGCTQFHTQNTTEGCKPMQL